MTSGFPLLTIIVFLPGGRRRPGRALIPRPRERAWPSRSAWSWRWPKLALRRLSASSTSRPARPASSSSASTRGSASSASRWKVGVDGISLFLVAMTALLFPIAMAGPTVDRQRPGLHGLDAPARGGVHGHVPRHGPLPLLRDVRGHPGARRTSSSPGGADCRRNYAAMKFFIYTFAGSAFLFVGILSLVLLDRPANDGHQTFDLITLTRLASSLPARRSGAHLRRLRRRLRRQDPAGAVPQLAARRLHRGADGRAR